MTEPFGDIIINDNCMFSSDILFLNSDSHCIFDNENNLINSASGILIHDHVWISRGAKILKNAEIGANSVVGAYSIVAKKFKHKNIAIAGNPAKEIAANIHWEREALYKYFDRVGIKQGMVEKVKSKIDARNDYFRNILPQHEYEKISENLASYIIK